MKFASFVAYALIAISLAGLLLFAFAGLNTVVYALIEGQGAEPGDGAAQVQDAMVAAAPSGFGSANDTNEPEFPR